MSQSTHLRLTLPDTLYVACQSGKLDTANFPLGFATPDGTDAASLKRRKTVDDWAGKNAVPTVIVNEPLEGFTFDKSVTRWRTSNKWFRIQDPRGFTLEISAENLGDVLLHAEISAGMLLQKYVWAREAGKNYLLCADHPDYIALKTPPVKKNLEIGDMVEFATGWQCKVQYVGRFYVYWETVATEYKHDDGSWHSNCPSRYYWGGSNNKPVVTRGIITAHKKQLYVFVTEKTKPQIIGLSSLPKKYMINNLTPYFSVDEIDALQLESLDTGYRGSLCGSKKKYFYLTKTTMDANQPLTDGQETVIV